MCASFIIAHPFVVMIAIWSGRGLPGQLHLLSRTVPLSDVCLRVPRKKAGNNLIIA
jgi:hypothetical protein